MEALAHRIVVDVSCGKWTTAAVAVPVGSVSTVDGRILGNERPGSDEEDGGGDGREEEEEEGEEPEVQGSFLEAGRKRANAQRAKEMAAREAREQQRRAAGQEAALRDTAGVDIVGKVGCVPAYIDALAVTSRDPAAAPGGRRCSCAGPARWA